MKVKSFHSYDVFVGSRELCRMLLPIHIFHPSCLQLPRMCSLYILHPVGDNLLSTFYSQMKRIQNIDFIITFHFPNPSVACSFTWILQCVETVTKHLSSTLGRCSLNPVRIKTNTALPCHCRSRHPSGKGQVRSRQV